MKQMAGPERRSAKSRKYSASRFVTGIESTGTTMRFQALLWIFGSSLVLLCAQEPVQTGVFTAAQAEAGRIAYENTCARCHTYSLRGRKGDPGEIPPVSSLSEADRKFVGNPPHVPPLAGEIFLSRWGDKTVSQLIARFDVTVKDPAFGFTNVDDETAVVITAYVLQANGGKAGPEPLTRSNKQHVNSAVR